MTNQEVCNCWEMENSNYIYWPFDEQSSHDSADTFGAGEHIGYGVARPRS